MQRGLHDHLEPCWQPLCAKRLRHRARRSAGWFRPEPTIGEDRALAIRSKVLRMTRSTMARTSASGCALSLSVLPRFSSAIHNVIVAAPVPWLRIKSDAYLHSEMVTGLSAAKFSRQLLGLVCVRLAQFFSNARHQEVTALTAPSGETLWQAHFRTVHTLQASLYSSAVCLLHHRHALVG